MPGLVDAVSNGVINGTSLTVAHTTTTDANRVMVNGVSTLSGADNISTVAYNAVGCTQRIKQQAGGGTSSYAYIYTLYAPSTGTNNVVVTTDGSSINMMSCNATYSDMKQSGIPDASGATTSADAVQTTKTTTITTVLDNCWTVMMVEDGSNGYTPVEGAGTTLRVVQGGGYGAGLFDSNGPISPAGSTSLTSTAVADNITQVMISIPTIPGAAAATTTRIPRGPTGGVTRGGGGIV